MLIESKVRAEIESIWAAACHPVRRARRFLALSDRLTGLAKHFANLGFRAKSEENPASRRLLWASSAKFLHYAQQAREFAKKSLSGGSPPLGFDYAPQSFATPTWGMGAGGPSNSAEATR